MTRKVTGWFRMTRAAVHSALHLDLRPLRAEMMLARLQAEFALEPVGQGER